MGKVYATGEQVMASDLTEVARASGVYAASSAGTDTYAITVAPTPTTYAAGDKYTFKADVANTGVASLNVNALGAKNIVKQGSRALENNDIAIGDVVEVVYDGTNFIILSMTPTTKSFGGASYSSGSVGATQNVDNAYTTPFKPNLIVVDYALIGAGSSGVYRSVGRALFQGTSCVANFLLKPASLGDTYAPSAAAVSGGSPDSGDSSHVGITVLSVSDTGFTVRVAFSYDGSYVGMQASYIVQAFQ